MVPRPAVTSPCICGLCGEITFDGSLADTTQPVVARFVDLLFPETRRR